MKNKLTAFFGGNIIVTICQLGINFWDELGSFGIKVLATLILGVAGGVAGLVGKDLLYPWIKKIFKIKTKTKNNEKDLFDV